VAFLFMDIQDFLRHRASLLVESSTSLSVLFEHHELKELKCLQSRDVNLSVMLLYTY